MRVYPRYGRRLDLFDWNLDYSAQGSSGRRKKTNKARSPKHDGFGHGTAMQWKRERWCNNLDRHRGGRIHALLLQLLKPTTPCLASKPQNRRVLRASGSIALSKAFFNSKKKTCENGQTDWRKEGFLQVCFSILHFTNQCKESNWAVAVLLTISIGINLKRCGNKICLASKILEWSPRSIIFNMSSLQV